MKSMKNYLPQLILVLFACLYLTPTLAADIELKGELTQNLTYGLDEKEFTGAVTDVKLSLEQEYGFDGKWYVSFNGKYDTTRTADKKFNLNLDEAYGSYYLENTDLTIGRQVINWGTADGINPTNYINPLSMNSFAEGSLNGTPVLAAQGTYYADNYDVTGVIVFDFVAQDLSGMSRFKGDDLSPQEMALYDALEDGLNKAYAEKDLQVPNKLENMEFAVQGETMVNGYDLKISYFRGWEDVPALILDPVSTALPQATARFRKVSKIGLATAGVIDTYGVWAEAAYNIPDKLKLARTELSLSMNKPYLQAVIGGDYTFDNGVYAEGEYLYYGNGSLLIPYNLNPGTEVEAGQYLLGRLSYDFNQDHSLEVMCIVNLDDRSALVIPSYTYHLNQVTDLKLSPVLTTKNGGELDNTISPGIGISLKTVF